MMKKYLWVILALLLVLAILPLPSQAAPLMKLSWRAEYYDNPSLSGAPKLVAFVDTLSIDYGLRAPAPELPADRFSIRFTTTRHIEKGIYLFLMAVDDGARVWLDGKLIIDAWDIGRKEDLQAKVYIEETGDHQIQVAYFENTGEALIHLEWLRLGGDKDIVGAWRGEYFNNKDLSGEPAMVRQDGSINFDWNSGSPSPKITRDNFSVRWTRSIYLDREGLWTFTIQHDDGMRIYVDGKIIYESWVDQSVIYKVRQIPLKAGYRTFTVEYYDHLGNAIAHVMIKGDPGDYGRDDQGQGGTGIVVDNDGSYFKWDGPTADRFKSRGGYGQNFYWTYNSGSGSINFGRWIAPISNAGNYEVFAYIPGDHASTTNARYEIHHFGKKDVRALNQSRYANEFVSLGIYYFDGSDYESVTLSDSTGESPDSTQIAFDAIKFVKR